MIAKELAMFLLAFCLAGGIINSIGIFSPVEIIDADAENITGDMTDKLMDEDNTSIASSSDISTSVDSWGLMLSTYDMVKKMFSVLLLPGPFLKETFLRGVEANSMFAVAFALFADAVQVIMNAALAWGLIQFALNRSTKQMD